MLGGAEGQGTEAEKGHKLSREDNYRKGLVCGRCIPITNSHYPQRAQPCHPDGQAKPDWGTLGFQTNPKVSLITLWLWCPGWGKLLELNPGYHLIRGLETIPVNRDSPSPPSPTVPNLMGCSRSINQHVL